MVLVAMLVVAASLGCSLVGRAVDQATGGAASTLQAVQTELNQALATLPAGMGGVLSTLPSNFGSAPATLPVQLPGSGEAGGTISGKLSYPSEGIPALKVVAFDSVSGQVVARIETAAGQSSYSLAVPRGMYNVVAYTLDGKMAGGYSMAVLCGLGADCTDHALLPVVVAASLPAEGIDPADWYAPSGSFPPAP